MNTFAHQCAHCEEIDRIPRAIAFFCSSCRARPGEACVDLRTIVTSRKPVGYIHAERQAFLVEVDARRPRHNVATPQVVKTA